MHRFFETIFVVQQPSYSSMFPLGQGLALAFGQAVFHCPWVGVLLTTGALCAFCYWMLRAWVRPEWALLGGLLAVCQFGPLCYWMNCYWGGAVSGLAGCLVFGALPRLCESGRVRHAIILGAGIALQMLTRPYESLLLVAAAAAYLTFALRSPGLYRKLLRPLPYVFLAVAPGLGLTLLHDRAVTGEWTTMPYQLSQYQYGVPAAFTFQPNPIPHRDLTPEQELDYRAHADVHGEGPETFGRFAARLAARVRFYRFFLLAPLYGGFAVFLVFLRKWPQIWVVFTLLLFALGTNLYPYFYPHYIAATACLFLLAAMAGLERLNRGLVAKGIIVLCAAHFLFWYGLRLVGGPIASSAGVYEAWDFINDGDPEGRIAIHDQLASETGKQLVFVRYSAEHGFHNWVQNAADIDAARVVWALDLGPAEDERLRHYYAGRAAWLLEPDASPPRLSRMDE
jgi:hypothetical protein